MVGETDGHNLPNGTDYENPWPKQHILRIKNADWGKKEDAALARKEKVEKSKFTVIKNRYTFKVARQTNYFVPYWCPYDLLGLFLGLLGPAPKGATLDNFFLPLKAVYGQWCGWIAGQRPGKLDGEPQNRGRDGAGDWPYCFQSTWERIKNSDGSETMHYSLGASIAGYFSNYEPVMGDFRFAIVKARIGILNDNGSPLKGHYRPGKSPKKEEEKEAQEEGYDYDGTDWGNCAETYPFCRKILRCLVGAPHPQQHGLQVVGYANDVQR